MTTLKTADDIRNLHSNVAQLPALGVQVAHWAVWSGRLDLLATEIADWVVAHTASHKPSQGYTNLFKPDYDRLAEIHTIVADSILRQLSLVGGQELGVKYEDLVNQCKELSSELHINSSLLSLRKTAYKIWLSDTKSDVAIALYQHIEKGMPLEYDNHHKSLISKLLDYVAINYEWDSLTYENIEMILISLEMQVFDQNRVRLSL